MIRRRALWSAGVLVAAATIVAGLLYVGSSAPPPRDASIPTDQRPAAVVGETQAGNVDVVLRERTERTSEVLRNEPRQPFRQQRLPLLAIAASIAALAALAVTSILARRRAGHTPVRVGRVVPARAPPLSLACS